MSVPNGAYELLREEVARLVKPYREDATEKSPFNMFELLALGATMCDRQCFTIWHAADWIASYMAYYRQVRDSKYPSGQKVTATSYLDVLPAFHIAVRRWEPPLVEHSKYMPDCDFSCESFATLHPVFKRGEHCHSHHA